MRVKLAAWSVTCVLLVAACSAGHGSSSSSSVAPSGTPAGTPISTLLLCAQLPGTLPSGNFRVPIPSPDRYLGIAVDGKGRAWFAEASQSRLGCYTRAQPIQEFQLTPQSNPSTLRSAPDGSVWFAEAGTSRIGRIGNDGRLTERQLDVHLGFPYWDVAVGPDGSVWFESYSFPNGAITRLWPDGHMTVFPVAAGWTATVDTHGNAWVPQNSRGIDRISDTGQVTDFKFASSVRGVAEASDGNIWFLNTRCLPVQQIGRIDSNGQTRFFDAPIVDDGAAQPDQMVRAPDGAIWFGTIDGRLIRLASETDVTVFTLPWSDAQIGPFAVLPGNHILMLGQQELLDFTAVNGSRVAGANAIPGPRARVAKDAAEVAANAAALNATDANANLVPLNSWEGDHAAIFQFDVNPNRCNGSQLWVYVVEDSGGWREYYSYRNAGAPAPSPGLKEVLSFNSGCLNVHELPTLQSKIVACFVSGTGIQIDQLPVYADGYVWWHLEPNNVPTTTPAFATGWAAQPFLFCRQDLNLINRPECR